MDSPVLTMPPSGMCHSATVPSVMVMPSLGIRISVAIGYLGWWDAECAAAGCLLQGEVDVDPPGAVAAHAQGQALARLEDALSLAIEREHARSLPLDGFVQFYRLEGRDGHVPVEAGSDGCVEV